MRVKYSSLPNTEGRPKPINKSTIVSASATRQALPSASPQGVVLHSSAATILCQQDNVPPRSVDDLLLLQLLVCSGHLHALDVRNIILNSRSRSESIDRALERSGLVTSSVSTIAQNVLCLYTERFLTFGQAARCLSHIKCIGEYPVTLSVEDLFPAAETSTDSSDLGPVSDSDVTDRERTDIVQSTLASTVCVAEEPDVRHAIRAAYSRLVAIMEHNGAYVVSECMQKQKIEWMEESEGRDHPQLVDELTELSGILCAEQKFPEAALNLLRIISMLETSKDYDGPRLANYLSMLAGIYLRLRQYAAAEPLLGRALTIRELYLPTNHPDISESLHDYGWLLYKTNREHEAQKLLVQAHVSRA